MNTSGKFTSEHIYIRPKLRYSAKIGGRIPYKIPQVKRALHCILVVIFLLFNDILYFYRAKKENLCCNGVHIEFGLGKKKSCVILSGPKLIFLSLLYHVFILSYRLNLSICLFFSVMNRTLSDMRCIF